MLFELLLLSRQLNMFDIEKSMKNKFNVTTNISLSYS